MCISQIKAAGASAQKPGATATLGLLQKRKGLTAQQTNANRAPMMAGGSLLGGGGPRLSMGSSLLSSGQ
jgi:hypothetical protein